MIEENVIETARNVPILDWLAAAGYDVTPGRNRLYYSPFHDERKPSFHIDERKNVWYDHGLGRGGDVIALVQQLAGKGFRDAVAELNGQTPTFSTPVTFKHEGYEKERKTRRNLAVVDLDDARLLEYSAKRGINADLLRRYCKQIEYDYTYKGNGNRARCIGFASDNGGWELRAPSRYSTDPDDPHSFKSSEGAKGITTLINSPAADTYVFEGFFTFLSFIALKGDEATRANAIVLNSVSNTKHATTYLVAHNELTGCIRLCLDNDKAGDDHTQELLDAIPAAVDVRPELLHGRKDFNDLLRGKPAKAEYIARAPFKARNSPDVGQTASTPTTTPASGQTPDVGQINRPFIVCFPFTCAEPIMVTPAPLSSADIAAGVVFRAVGATYMLDGYNDNGRQRWEGYTEVCGHFTYRTERVADTPARTAAAILAVMLGRCCPPSDFAAECSLIDCVIRDGNALGAAYYKQA